MNKDIASMMKSVCTLLDEYRTQCLWYLREDYYPKTPAEACRVLKAIEQHGDVVAFKKAAMMRQWLLRNSNEPFVA